jgi:hypothetical protein
LDTLWQTNIAIENGHLQLIFPLKMVIFHSYVKLPEGNKYIHFTMQQTHHDAGCSDFHH